ncbi:AAA family ATPase [Sphingopyxis sp. JAI128]|uniref:AAA family ATPase n=1 Tax=Sphingopyxis sp. JAI128 TaxID=2723066 RepID=UPI0017AEA40B|nr:AAA family ATPase [Sphingopyxis sp. JAI128]MBB6425778.1 DNA polymerase III delta prime subunit [Sphingopyxis sp. JAI128]
MDEKAFSDYLNWKGATATSAQDTRIRAVRKIEDNLAGLGFAHPDLDAAFAADGFAALRARLRAIRADASEGGEDFRILMPQSDKPDNRLANYSNWLADYGRALVWRDGEEVPERFAAGMEKLRFDFLARMPDFERFSDEEGSFYEQETGYKRAARGSFLIASADPDASAEERGRGVYKSLLMTTRQGLPLGWRTQSAIGNAGADVQRGFYETVARLARLDGDALAELEGCARELEALQALGVETLKRGEILNIALSVFGTTNPHDGCWFKARTFDRLGKLLLGRRLFTAPRFELADFEEFQGLVSRMRETLEDWGWSPESLMDVQGFIWVAMSEDEEMANDDLTREAVEAAMSECEAIGLDAFLVKYGFGKPRDYWTRRVPGGRPLPAKATVGAAYGFMPGGRSKSAKEFHGGYGEQAANSILKRLGFEIIGKETGVEDVADMMIDDPETEHRPTNLILYGPPGTGKTFRTAVEAVRLCGEPVPADRSELMASYRRLSEAKRIEFVTFHQSMSYEDFVEGKQPVTGADGDESGGAGGFRLETFPGIFRRIARRAETSLGSSRGPDAVRVGERQVFKMSIGEAANPEDAHLFEEAITEGHTLLGFGDIDWSDEKYAAREAIMAARRERGDSDEELSPLSGRVQMPFIFRNWMRKDDLIIVSKGNSLFRAIGVVEGDYEYRPRPEGSYAHRRKVKWLWTDREGVPVSEIYRRKFSMRSVYLLTKADLDIPALERYLNSQQSDAAATGTPDQFVLVIDEINRANISKVFGELITLLEPDKRLGQPNELKVRLPYSEDEFGVPSNLHIVGTMNTADRSIALLDTALRRRFDFLEMMPDPAVLSEAALASGVDLPRLLRILNERIEYLFDREHQVGHAYFIGCRSRADVDERMRGRVIPLLTEYFYEDWTKVAAILGDPKGERFLSRHELKAPACLDEDGDMPPRWRWSVRETFAPDAYSGLA